MEESDNRYIVLGGGFAGIEAAFELASEGVKPVLIDNSEVFEYTPGLPDLFRERFSENKLTAEYEKLLEGTGVEFKQASVIGVDTGRKAVETTKGAYNYKGLIVALGSEMNDLGMDLSEVDNAYSLEAAKDLKNKSENVESVTVLGAGYVGVEVAGELAEKGLDVKVVDVSTRPMPKSNDKASEIALNYFNRRNISFKAGRKVERVEGKTLVMQDEERIGSDMLVFATGIRATKVVRESFDTDSTGLEVNKGFSTDFENVFAVGDCSSSSNMDTAHDSIREGKIAARNVLKKDNEVLETYDSEAPLIVSFGKKAVLTYGDTAIMSRFFRRIKDGIRLWYFLHLKKRSIFGRVLN